MFGGEDLRPESFLHNRSARQSRQLFRFSFFRFPPAKAGRESRIDFRAVDEVTSPLGAESSRVRSLVHDKTVLAQELDAVFHGQVIIDIPALRTKERPIEKAVAFSLEGYEDTFIARIVH